MTRTGVLWMTGDFWFFKEAGEELLITKPCVLRRLELFNGDVVVEADGHVALAIPTSGAYSWTAADGIYANKSLRVSGSGEVHMMVEVDDRPKLLRVAEKILCGVCQRH